MGFWYNIDGFSLVVLATTPKTQAWILRTLPLQTWRQPGVQSKHTSLCAQQILWRGGRPFSFSTHLLFRCIVSITGLTHWYLLEENTFAFCIVSTTGYTHWKLSEEKYHYYYHYLCENLWYYFNIHCEYYSGLVHIIVLLLNQVCSTFSWLLNQIRMFIPIVVQCVVEDEGEYTM